MINGEQYSHKFCADDDIFWNINIDNCKVFHVLGHGLMIQLMILILIKCFSTILPESMILLVHVPFIVLKRMQENCRCFYN